MTCPSEIADLCCLMLETLIKKGDDVTIKLDGDLTVSIKQDQTKEQLDKIGEKENISVIYIPKPEENQKVVLICEKTVVILSKS